jgi:hypothetical protein
MLVAIRQATPKEFRSQGMPSPAQGPGQDRSDTAPMSLGQGEQRLVYAGAIYCQKRGQRMVVYLSAGFHEGLSHEWDRPGVAELDQGGKGSVLDEWVSAVAAHGLA